MYILLHIQVINLDSLHAEELILLNCRVREDSLESLGQQGDQTNQPQRKSTLDSHWKDGR